MAAEDSVGPMDSDYDLVVIGGGAAGLGAARTGARAGARTLMVQDGPVGGDCTFTGCVPSKTLIEAAGRGEGFGAAIAAVHAAVERIAATETADVLRREGIDVIAGRAAFRSPTALEIEGRRVRAQRCVVATGAGPLVPPIPGLDRVPSLTNETVFDLTAAPPSLAVLGGGAIGCELAQAFRRFGTEVTVVEAQDRLLAEEEPEASAVIEEVFAREGIAVRVGSEVTAVKAPDEQRDGVRLRLDGGDAVDAERLLVAVGRSPVTDGLELDRVGVALDDRGYVRTDDQLRTTAPGIYAVGDVTGRLPFTHAADEMGRLAARNALRRRGRPSTYDPRPTPWVTFTAPEVARVGMTEAEAARHGGRVAWLPMSEVDRAVAAGETEGFVKLIAGPRRVLRRLGGGQVLGATIVAPRAGEMIHEPALAMRTRMFAGRLAQATHAYPTWSSAVQLAAAQWFGEIGGRRARRAR